MQRTTLMLDEATRQKAKDLARILDCSASEAIRRAVQAYHEQVGGVSDERRRARTEALRRLIALSDGQDPEAEVLGLKSEDAGF